LIAEPFVPLALGRDREAQFAQLLSQLVSPRKRAVSTALIKGLLTLARVGKK
jgi:hypothetical protein